jgi:catechol 2,3-dioxygenase-like lactoylglutathione lyase family enzyme
MTPLLAVRDARRARAFYADVLGGPDRADAERVPYETSVSSFMNLRVANIGGCRDWRARGTHFDMRDPDGYLIEVGQATALVEGRLAEQAPAGREAARADGR